MNVDAFEVGQPMGERNVIAFVTTQPLDLSYLFRSDDLDGELRFGGAGPSGQANLHAVDVMIRRQLFLGRSVEGAGSFTYVSGKSKDATAVRILRWQASNR